MIRFEHPWVLLGLLLLPLLGLLRRRRRSTRPPALLWGTLAGLPSARLQTVLGAVLGALPALALTCTLVALARPQQGLQQSEVESRGVDIVIALDRSPSMRAQDMGGGTRLEVARSTARSFVRGRPHDRIGLVAFAGSAYTQCPLTLDHDTLAELLAQLDFVEGDEGTAIGMGLATSVQRLRESRSPSKVVVLLTDGENNRGAIEPVTAAELAAALGVKVYTVLVGRPTVAPVEVDDPVLGRRLVMQPVGVAAEPLMEIAQRTGGRFFRASDAAALSGIYGEIDRLERAPIRSLVYREYHDLGPSLLALAAALLAVAAFSGATWAARVP